MTYKYDYCGFNRWDWMESLAAILVRRAAVGNHIRRWGWDELPTEYKNDYKDPNPDNYRTWFEREHNAAPMHPAIREAVYQAPPADWHLLVLEWPHASESDPSRIAYTRSDEHGYADRQTVTSVGKYLARHFPTLADHRIRDIVMRHAANRFEMWDTVEKIVQSVQDGPQSCMRWGGHSPSDTHPYEVYAPEYGWRAAVRLDGNGLITARCLVNVESMTFVRSYSRKDGQYSHSDEAIEVWLRDQGYTKECDWVGLKLKRITKHRYEDDFWAPYLDGDCKHVEDRGTHLLIDNSGDYECDRTDGHASGASSCSCNDCGERHHEDDMTSIGYHGDYSVGPCCIDSYTHVYGRNGCEYYIPENDAVYVESTGNHYDPDHLERYSIVELDNGDYVEMDDAVHLEYRDIWVASDDDCWVHCTHSGTTEHAGDCVQLENGDWALECDAWQCEHDDAWYLCDEVQAFETECGKTIHPDHADEYATETNNEEN
jgi:hypothetical protein